MLYLLLAFSSFCLPPRFAFGVPLATLPLFRFGFPGIYLVDLLFDSRLGFFPRLYLRGRLRRRGVDLLRLRLPRLRCFCGGWQDYSGRRWRFSRNAALIPSWFL